MNSNMISWNALANSNVDHVNELKYVSHWNAVADSNVDRVQDRNLLTFCSVAFFHNYSHVICPCYVWTQ